MKKWSRIIALLLVAVMMFTMVVSCNKPKEPDDPSDDPNPPSGPSEPSGPSKPSGPSEPSGPSNPSGPSEPQIPLTKEQILAAIKAAGVSTLNSTVKIKFEGAMKAPALGIDDYEIPNFEKELDNITINDVDITDFIKALLIELAFVSGEDTKYESTAELLEALVSALGSFNTNFDADYGSIEGYLTDTLLTGILADNIASLAIDVIAPEKTIVLYVNDMGEEFDENNQLASINWYNYYEGTWAHPYCFWNEQSGKFELAIYDDQNDRYVVAGNPVDPEAPMYSKVIYTGRVYDDEAYIALAEELEAPVSSLIKNVFKGATLSVLLDDVNAICALIKNDMLEKLVASVSEEVDKLENGLADGANYALTVTIPAIYEAIKANSDITDYDDNKLVYDRMFAILLGNASPVAVGDYASAFAIVYSEVIAYISAKNLVDGSPKYSDEIYNSADLFVKDGVFYNNDGTEYELAEGTYLSAPVEVNNFWYFDDTDGFMFAGRTLEAAQAAYPEKDIYTRVLCNVIGFDPAEYDADLLGAYNTIASILENAIYSGKLTIYDIAASTAFYAYTTGTESDSSTGGGTEPLAMVENPITKIDFISYSLITLLAKADFVTALKEVYATGADLGYNVESEAKLASDFASAVAAAKEAFSPETGNYLNDVVLKVISDVLADEDNAAFIDSKLGTGMSAEIKFFADYYAENEGFEKTRLAALCDNIIGMMGSEPNQMAVALIETIKAYALSLDEGVDTVTVDGVIIAVLSAFAMGENAEQYIGALETAMASGEPNAIAEAIVNLVLSESLLSYYEIDSNEPDPTMQVVDLIAMGDLVKALVNYINADETTLEAAEAELIAKAEAADAAYADYLLSEYYAGNIANVGLVARLAHVIVDLRTLDIAEFEYKYGMSDKLLDAVSALVANMYYMNISVANNFEADIYTSAIFEILFKLTLTDTEYSALIEAKFGTEDVLDSTIYTEYVEGDEYYVEGNLALVDFLDRKADLKVALGEYLMAYITSDGTTPIDNVYYVLSIGNALDPDTFASYFDAYTDEEDPTHAEFYELVKDDVSGIVAMIISNYTGLDYNASIVLATVVVAPERIVENAPAILAIANSGDYDDAPGVKYMLYVISAVGHLAMDDEAILENEVDFEEVLGFIPLPEGFENIDYNALALNIRSKTDILAEINSLLTAEIIPTVTDNETVILIDINIDYSFGVIVFDFDLDIEFTL